MANELFIALVKINKRIFMEEQYDNFSKRHHVLDVLGFLLQKKKAGEPASLIRLGDGEGRLLGFPEFVNKQATSNEVSGLDHSLQIWFGRDDFQTEDLLSLSTQLREAVKNADIVGLPRLKQYQAFHVYRYVAQAISQFDLLNESQIITDAAIHRYLQFGLFYRLLLDKLDFVGLITGRPQLADIIKNTFSIKELKQYLIPAEAIHPGGLEGEHYPDRFNSLKIELQVPYKGAIFLVGAGALGKIYCNWIKQLGGIAIDIGHICDSWSNQGRTGHEYHQIEQYKKIPDISLAESVKRYNAACAYTNLDAKQPQQEDIDQLIKNFGL